MDILQRYERIISPYSLLPEATPVVGRPGSLPAFIYSSWLPDKEGRGIPVFGVGIARDQALAALLGEGVERYAWLYPPAEEVQLAKPGELTPHISVKEAGLLMHRHTPARVREEIDHTVLPWLPGRSFPGEETVWVPVPDLFRRREPEEIFQYFTSTTSGIAAGTTFEQASVFALLEVVERDAVMKFWYGNRPGVQVHPELSEPYRYLVHEIQARGLSLLFVDITASELPIPVVLSLIHGDDILLCGMASRFSLESAAEKALLEAVSMWNTVPYFYEEREPLKPEEVQKGFPSIRTFLDHVFLYTHSWAAQHARSFFYARVSEGKTDFGRSNISDVQGKFFQQQFQFLVSLFSTRGYSIVLLDLTPQDVKILEMYVVKAVVPGMVPITVGMYLPLGKEDSFDWDRWPHPFP